MPSIATQLIAGLVLLFLSFSTLAYLLLPPFLTNLQTFITPAPASIPYNLNAYYGSGNRHEDDLAILPFILDLPEEDIENLRNQLLSANFPNSIQDAAPWSNGLDASYFKTFIEYWRTTYLSNYKARQEALNEFPQFTTEIDGLNVHFLHIRTSPSPPSEDDVALVLVHGWPGTYVEFVKLVHDHQADLINSDAFSSIIIPSIPGYGFSSQPAKKGFDVPAAAVTFSKLVKKLGYKKMFLQGGDWGAMITSAMCQLTEAKIDPTLPKCVALHLNFITIAFPPFKHGGVLAYAIGTLTPSLILNEQDSMKMFPPFPAQNIASKLVSLGGYFMTQSTKPDTIGMALDNSPVALAAWILEKFHAWSYRFEETDSGLDKDEMIDNIMVYYITKTLTSSARFYRENTMNPGTFQSVKASVSTPTALADFPGELIRVPESWSRTKFYNLKRYTTFKRGGHFAALEVPELLVRDVLAFWGELKREERGRGGESGDL